MSVIVGVRGYGKTYGFKKKGIRNFLDKGEGENYYERRGKL